MTVRITSSPDPMALGPIISTGYAAGYRESRAVKTACDPRLIAGQRYGVVIGAGQSLMAATSEGLFTPINTSKISCLNVEDGAMLDAADPLVGCDQYPSDATKRACTLTRAADELITTGDYDRIIIVNVAVGQTRVDQWNTGDTVYPQPLHNRIIVARRRLLALGITQVDAVLWQLGETDIGAGTTPEQYVSRFNSMKAKIDAVFTAPWIVAVSTFVPWAGTNAGMRAAQQSLVDNVSVFAGPDSDVIPIEQRFDQQHYGATANANIASRWAISIRALP